MRAKRNTNRSAVARAAQQTNATTMALGIQVASGRRRGHRSRRHYPHLALCWARSEQSVPTEAPLVTAGSRS